MADPVIAQRGPLPVRVKRGACYRWCSCGRSRTQPFCDDSHVGTGFEPLQWTADEDETVMFCGCKHSRDQPFCDRSHRQLK